MIEAWIIAAIIFLVLEMLVPGTFLFIVIALSLTLSGVASWLGYSLQSSISAGFIAFVLGFFITRKLLNLNLFSSKEKQRTDSNTDLMIGQMGIVTNPVGPNNPGRVLINGEEWRSLPEDNSFFDTNSKVTVITVQGNTLLVKKHENE